MAFPSRTMPRAAGPRAAGRPRVGALGGALVFVCFLSSHAAAEDLARAARELRTKFTADIEQLAASCDQQGLAEQAKKTRAIVRVPDDPYKLYLPMLPREVGPPALPEDAPPEVVAWNTRLLELRRKQASALYELARRALRNRKASLAYELVLAAIRANPDHEGARRVFGYQKYRTDWCTAYEARKLRSGMVWHEKFGWLSKGQVRHYEQGQRPSGSRWISAEEDAKRHRDINSGWEIETEHYLIRTNHSIEAGVSLATKLENLHRLWQQVFLSYYASETYVNGLFDGRSQAARADAPRYDVVYFRDKEDYVRSLKAAMPNIAMSSGVYMAGRRTAYFFAGGRHVERTTYHEATHQLFQQSRRVAKDVGRRANFWVIEGIAMFMETLHEEDGYHALGGLNDQRMNAARYHLLKDDFYVPFARLTEYGMEKLQKDPKISSLYSQSAAMTNFLVYYDSGRYRDALVAYLSAVYNGKDSPGTLAELTGATYEELDAQYREFMRIGVRAE